MRFSIFQVLCKLPHKNVCCNSLNEKFFHTSTSLSVKKITEQKEGKTTVVEGTILESGRGPYLLKTPHDKDACSLCRLNLQNINFTDVLILSQFVRKDGCMLPRRITGLCRIMQKKVSTLVSMAHIAGLMPNLVPAYSKKDCFKKRRDWKKYNTYFDPNTIFVPDPYYRSKNDIKKRYYLSKGVSPDVIEAEPWRERPVVDINVKKLTMY